MERIIWIDFLKVLAAFFVVLLHSTSPILYEYGNIDIDIWKMGNYVDSFVRQAVPLFFMISGVLLLNKSYENLYLFFKKRFIKVIIPLLFWSIIYILFRKYIINQDIDIVKQLILMLLYPQYYHLWFLYTIVGIYLFIPIFNIFIVNSNKTLQYYFISLWIISVSLIPLFNKLGNFDIPNYMPMLTGYSGYLLIGYAISNIKISKKIFYFSLLMITISTLLTILFTENSSKELNKFDDFYYGYFSFTTLIQSISFFIITKFLVENIDISKIIIKSVSSVASTSLGIYIIHPIILYIIENNFSLNVVNGSILLLLLIAISTFGISFLLIYFLQKTSYLKYVLPK